MALATFKLHLCHLLLLHFKILHLHWKVNDDKYSCYVKDNYSHINVCNFTFTSAFDNPSHYLPKS